MYQRVLLVLLWLLLTAAPGPAVFSQNLFGGADEPLSPDEAFHFSAAVETPEALRLLWTIAKETYLYREKIHITLEDTPEARLGPIRLPPGIVKQETVRPDGSIGDQEIYHDGIDLLVPLLRSTTTPTQATLVVKYQGCAERGICYPPITKQVILKLPSVGAARAAGDTPPPVSQTNLSPPALPAVATTVLPQAEPLAEQDRLAALLHQGNLWGVVATFFGLGLLLAFTPCIFPMIPILSGIIAGHGRQITPWRAFWLSLVYVLAMAFTYTLLGVLAGLFGQNLQATFQNPWILTGFALVFVALALSMFGLYDLQVPTALQSRVSDLSNRHQGGGLVGVAIMGLLSALIVGPCVAPPLAGALIYIGQTGDALQGGLALFALSLGMGMPLIVIGTSAGQLLPRAGIWMEAIKGVFGVLMLGVAILLVERILPASVAMALWGGLLICSAVAMGALDSLPVAAGGFAKLWKGLGVALLIYGALMLVGAGAGGKDTLQPLRGLIDTIGAARDRPLAFQRIKTGTDLDRVLAAATAQGRPAFVDVSADWCASCQELDSYTFSDPKVQQILADFVRLKADVTANDGDDKALLHRLGIFGPPALIFYDRNGRERRNDRFLGFLPAASFVAHAEKASQ